MGLPMAARVVLDHHGTIGDRNTDVWTVFRVSLSAYDPQDAPQAVRAELDDQT